MPKNLIECYRWLVDTLRHHGPMTRRELNERWRRSLLSNGKDLPRRSFYNYREGIWDTFNIEIKCNQSTWEYYIEEDDGGTEATLNEWMLNSASVSAMLSESRDVADRIVLENIPSSHHHLNTVCQAMRLNMTLKFDYSPYYRSATTHGIQLEPYFLKIFHQRWYVTGLNVGDGKVKTYALDRCADMEVTSRKFELPYDFDAHEFCANYFGVVFSKGEVEEVIVRVDPRNAKYLRTLPLHDSQREKGYDAPFSDFSFRMRVTPDFIRELLSFGPSLEVVSPQWLREEMARLLKKSLDNYLSDGDGRPSLDSGDIEDA